jgi:hypothetical protein
MEPVQSILSYGKMNHRGQKMLHVYSKNGKPFSGLKIFKNKKVWFKRGLYHRVDGPAVIWNSGNSEWYKEGRRHRLGGPAICGSSHHQEWWEEGRPHRLDGPAIIFLNKYKHWYYQGRLLGFGAEGFWALWNHLTSEQRENLTLLTFLPGSK